MNQTLFYRAMLIPSVVWLSVLFGAAAGTGREVVEFFGSAGAWGGVVTIIVIVLMFALGFFLCFELARLFKAYDYQLLCIQLLGKCWPAYEITILLGMILSLGIISAAAGEIISMQFGFPSLWGTGGMLLLIIALTYSGRVLIEKTMALASVLLLIALVYIGVQVAGNDSLAVVSAFANSEIHFGGVQKGLTYSFVNISYIPLILYAGRDIRSRGESVIGATCAAIAGMLPLLLLHIIFSSSYPEIRDAELPTFWLLERVSDRWFVDVYVIIIFIMFVQTGVGMVQGFLERIDGWYSKYHDGPMSPIRHSALSFLTMTISVLLSTVGFVELVRNGYWMLSYGFMLTFLIPLVTVGAYKVYRGSGSDEEH